MLGNKHSSGGAQSCCLLCWLRCVCRGHICSIHLIDGEGLLLSIKLILVPSRLNKLLRSVSHGHLHLLRSVHLGLLVIHLLLIWRISLISIILLLLPILIHLICRLLHILTRLLIPKGRKVSGILETLSVFLVVAEKLFLHVSGIYMV